MPSPAVSDVDALSVPDAVLQDTVTPDNFCPCESVTLTVRGSESLLPTSAAGCASPDTRTTAAGVLVFGPAASPQAIVQAMIAATNGNDVLEMNRIALVRISKPKLRRFETVGSWSSVSYPRSQFPASASRLP